MMILKPREWWQWKREDGGDEAKGNSDNEVKEIIVIKSRW